VKVRVWYGARGRWSMTASPLLLTECAQTPS
jgi:hypothetical protein